MGGGHWDPKAACGPASGNNAACGVCKNPKYECGKETFDPKSKVAGYWFKDPNACEFGDLSGMAGVLQGDVCGSDVIKVQDAKGMASMTAKFGKSKQAPKLSTDACGSRKQFIRATAFKQAGGLDLLHGKSIVVHCSG